MSTGKPRDPNKEQFWRRMVRLWQQSGLSVRVFCDDHGLSQPSFYAWRRTLQQRDQQAPAFLPVRVIPDNTPAPPAPSGVSGLELILAHGRVLRIGPAFDDSTLQRLLALLEEGQS